ncbi:hypothetical protein CTAYLR_008356, partial [Chrysophaeum taylorii]
MLESLCDHDCLTNEGRPRGRNFLFGGRSSLCEPRVWDICEAEVQNNLEIEGSAVTSNNLGGNGPRDDVEEVIQFADIVPDSPDNANPVDLVVSVTEGTESYQVANASYNGRWHDFMMVNVRDNTRAFLDFTFVDSVTGQVVELEEFVITVYDVDQQTDPSVQRESFCIDDDEYHEYILSDTSTLRVTKQSESCAGGEGSSVVFSSTRAGFLCDNPTSSLLDVVTCDQCEQCAENQERLSPYFPIDQSDRAVSLAFIGPQSKFSLVLQVECEDCNDQPSGRNFVFGGRSSLCDPTYRTRTPTRPPTSKPTPVATPVPTRREPTAAATREPTAAATREPAAAPFDLALTRMAVFDGDDAELDFFDASNDTPRLYIGEVFSLSHAFASTTEAHELQITTY